MRKSNLFSTNFPSFHISPRYISKINWIFATKASGVIFFIYCEEGWTLKNWCFWTVVLEKTLQSPLDSKEMKPVNPKGNQSWLILKLKLQYFGHLMWRTDSLEKTLMLGMTEDRRRRGRQRMRWLDGIIDSIDMSLSKLPGGSEGQGSLVCCSPWGSKESDMREKLNWIELDFFTRIPNLRIIFLGK